MGTHHCVMVVLWVLLVWGLVSVPVSLVLGAAMRDDRRATAASNLVAATAGR